MASEGRARVEVANPELEFTERDYQRVQSLFAQRIASQQALDDAQRAYEMARNRRQLLAAEVTSAEARVIQARARVAAARAALDRAEENQRYATIRSPIDGIVLARDTEVGDAVSSILNLGSMATLIMTLGDLSTVYVKGEVDEAEIGRIRADLPVRTRVESFPDETFPGTVTRLAPMGKKQNNVTTFEARVSISNPQGRLRVHMSAHAEIILEEHKQALLVPEAALLYDKDRRASVQRLDPSAKTGFRKIAVQTGISNGRKTEILGGLAENDALVLP
jgi:HlyD family secretion protein